MNEDRAGVLAGLLAGVAAALAGCSAPTVPYHVAVRDAATREPVAGAHVIAQTLHHYHPMAYGDIITQKWRGSFEEGATDDAGVAHVRASDTRPVRFLVFVEGRGMQEWFFDPPPANTDWAAGVQAGGAALEAKVQRAAGSGSAEPVREAIQKQAISEPRWKSAPPSHQPAHAAPAGASSSPGA